MLRIYGALFAAFSAVSSRVSKSQISRGLPSVEQNLMSSTGIGVAAATHLAKLFSETLINQNETSKEGNSCFRRALARLDDEVLHVQGCLDELRILLQSSKLMVNASDDSIKGVSSSPPQQKQRKGVLATPTAAQTQAQKQFSISQIVLHTAYALNDVENERIGTTGDSWSKTQTVENFCIFTDQYSHGIGCPVGAGDLPLSLAGAAVSSSDSRSSSLSGFQGRHLCEECLRRRLHFLASEIFSYTTSWQSILSLGFKEKYETAQNLKEVFDIPIYEIANSISSAEQQIQPLKNITEDLVLRNPGLTGRKVIELSFSSLFKVTEFTDTMGRRPYESPPKKSPEAVSASSLQCFFETLLSFAVNRITDGFTWVVWNTTYENPNSPPGSQKGRVEIINLPHSATPLVLGYYPLLCFNFTTGVIMEALDKRREEIENSAKSTTIPPPWSRAARNPSSNVTRSVAVAPTVSPTHALYNSILGSDEISVKLRNEMGTPIGINIFSTPRFEKEGHGIFDSQGKYILDKKVCTLHIPPCADPQFLTLSRLRTIAAVRQINHINFNFFLSQLAKAIAYFNGYSGEESPHKAATRQHRVELIAKAKSAAVEKYKHILIEKSVKGKDLEDNGPADSAATLPTHETAASISIPESDTTGAQVTEGNEKAEEKGDLEAKAEETQIETSEDMVVESGTCEDGTTTFMTFASKVTRYNYSDGTIVDIHPDGTQVTTEKTTERAEDGTEAESSIITTEFKDGTILYQYSNGSSIEVRPDGTRLVNGEPVNE